MTKDNDQLSSNQLRTIHIITGIGTGSCLAAFFNPWDRALYKSMKDNVPFLRWSNFTSPYQGAGQAIVQRSFTWGLYYIMQGELNLHVRPIMTNDLKWSESTSQCVIGLSAGSMNGAMTNGISAVKYHTWGHDDRKFFSSIREMWNLGGIKPFFKGALTTCNRDMVFGSIYESLRHRFIKKLSSEAHPSHQLQFVSDSIAAGFATVGSAPFNYVRNMKYATPPDKKPPNTATALQDLWKESKTSNSTIAKLQFFQHRFRIGWGTARVATGMAVGQMAFDYSKSALGRVLKNKD